MQSEELHIASLVVLAAPARVGDVRTRIAGMAGACVHASSPQGRLVIIVEQPTADTMTEAVTAIQRMPGVLSAALVYQCADTLQAMNEEMPNAQA